MMQIWIVLIFLHRGSSLISVTTAQLGEPVTFTCLISNSDYSATRVKWYKQSNGDTLRLITTLLKATEDPGFEEGFSPSRFAAKYTPSMSTLTILKTIKEDEAMYHCAVFTWKTDEWSGTYFSLKESNARIRNYTVVQLPTVSDVVQPGDSVTFQCSVLSHSQMRSCPSEHTVSWFRVRQDTSNGSIIYTDVQASHGCDWKPETSSDSKSCVYQISKNITSSDGGTYYCALAMCGEILFGNGTKLEIEVESSRQSLNGLTLVYILMALCGLSFVITTSRIKWNAGYCLQENIEKQTFKNEDDMLIYSTAVYTMIKNTSNGRKHAKAVKMEKNYAAFEPFVVD